MARRAVDCCSGNELAFLRLQFDTLARSDSVPDRAAALGRTRRLIKRRWRLYRADVDPIEDVNSVASGVAQVVEPNPAYL